MKIGNYTLAGWIDPEIFKAAREEYYANLNKETKNEVKNEITVTDNGGIKEPAFYRNSQSVDFDTSTFNIDGELSQKAYRILKEAGYSGDTFVFNFEVDKEVGKYAGKNGPTPFEHKFDNAESMLASIFDSQLGAYINDAKFTGYKNIQITMHAPQSPIKNLTYHGPEKPDLIGVYIDFNGTGPILPDYHPNLENTLVKFNGIIFDTAKSPVQYNADSDAMIYSKANFRYKMRPAYIEGAYFGNGANDRYYSDYADKYEYQGPNAHATGYAGGTFGHGFLNIDVTKWVEHYAQNIKNNDKNNYGFGAFTELIAARGLEYFGGYFDGLEKGVLLDTGETFLGWVNQHYSDKQIEGVDRQLIEAIREYGEQLKNGGNINGVKQKINFDGFEFSLNEFLRVHDGLRQIVQNTDHGSGGIRSYVNAGAAISAVRQFTENELDKETGDKVFNLFESRIKKEFARRDNDYEPDDRFEQYFDENKYGSKAKEYNENIFAPIRNTLNGYFGEGNRGLDVVSYQADAYKLFSNLRGSKQEIQNGFNLAKKWVVEQLGIFYDKGGWAPHVRDRAMAEYDDVLNRLYNAVFR